MRRKIVKARLNAFKVAPDVIKAMLALEEAAQAGGLEKSLVHLVKLRASQINGCAYCVDMHTKEARRDGETEQRLYLVSAWHESPLYTPRERAAFAWTDALTRVADTRAPDDVYEEARKEFSEEELVKLTLLIVAINGWNRFAVGFRTVHPV
jgi:AhpD family alkylhydroperoxidase